MSADTPFLRTLLAVPGDPGTRTGGYGYARALVAHGPEAGLLVEPWPLPDGFPDPDAATLEETARRLAMAPAGWPMIVDGLALGTLPPEMLGAVDGPVLALCHHPLALETGLAPDRAEALRRSERAALAACDGVIATSEATAATLSEDYGVPRARLTVAHPGTEPAPPARGCGAAPDVALLSVGSLVPRKGHLDLVDALARIGPEGWRLTLAGPDTRDPAHAAELRAAIARAGLAGRIEITGAIGPDRLEELYDAADVFVLPSHHEGYGMAFAEALARGLPVVGCDVGAVAEATRGAARLVRPGDPQALAAALGPLVSDPGARAALAGASRRAAEALPRWADTARAIRGAVEAASAPARAVETDGAGSAAT